MAANGTDLAYDADAQKADESGCPGATDTRAIKFPGAHLHLADSLGAGDAVIYCHGSPLQS